MPIEPSRDNCLTFSLDGHWSVRIYLDGRVETNPRLELDHGTNEFWKAVASTWIDAHISHVDNLTAATRDIIRKNRELRNKDDRINKLQTVGKDLRLQIQRLRMIGPSSPEENRWSQIAREVNEED